MTESKADTASTQKADDASTAKAPAKPAAKKATTTRKSTTKSAAENENLPSASAAAVASEAAATADPNTLTAPESTKIEDGKGGFGPFNDTAPPVGAALEETTKPDKIDTELDFPTNEAFTETVGDVTVAVRLHNQRNVVEVAPAGWTGPGQIFAPYQAKLLHEALGKVVGKLKKA